MMKCALSMALLFALLLSPTNMTSQCDWGSRCVTEPCAWECWTVGHGEWASTCYSWQHYTGTWYCCVCEYRTIQCNCIVGTDTGTERRRSSFANDICASPTTGVCVDAEPPP